MYLLATNGRTTAPLKQNNCENVRKWLLLRVLVPISIYLVSVYRLAVLRYLNINTIGEKRERGAEICILVTLDKQTPANL
jgi:hypothetical protein